jgi:hypothetical protein
MHANDTSEATKQGMWAAAAEQSRLNTYTLLFPDNQGIL